jgi:triosephosphate isomerase (TIM)
MRKIIFGNWKSNKSIAEAQEWLNIFKQELGNDELGVDAVIAPPFPFMPIVKDGLPEQALLGSQDISSYSAGSYTGAVSTQNLSGLNISYTLVGHSERRRYFQETADMVNQKISQALSASIKPIVCVDENTLEELKAKADQSEIEQCLIAYEPLASIGTGNNAPLEDVKNFVQKVKSFFGDVPVLYGGSVDEKNIAEYLLVTDGIIIGGASLDASQFVKVLRTAQGENPLVHETTI